MSAFQRHAEFFQVLIFLVAEPNHQKTTFFLIFAISIIAPVHVFYAVLGTRNIYVDLSHRCFFENFPRVTRHKFQLLKLVSTPIRAHTAGSQTLHSPPSGHAHPSLSSGHLPHILLVAKLSTLRPAVMLTPAYPAVIFHPSCWRSNSPLSA